MPRGLVPALLVAVLSLDASTALASSDDLSTIGPMATLTVSGDERVFALTSAGQVVWRSSSTREWTPVDNPSGVTFYLGSGLASAQPASWYPRVYAVSVPSGSTPAKLWELDANNDTWSPPLDYPSGESLADAPSLAATATPSGVEAALRLRDGHVYECFKASSTGPCQWADASWWGAPLAEPNSPVETVYNQDTGKVDTLWISSGGRLNLIDWSSGWQMLPALWNTYYWVDTTDISVLSKPGDFRVLVTAWNGVDYGDQLWLADSPDGGSKWDWTYLYPQMGSDPTLPRIRTGGSTGSGSRSTKAIALATTGRRTTRSSSAPTRTRRGPAWSRSRSAATARPPFRVGPGTCRPT